MPSDHFYSRLSHNMGATGLRLAGKLNVPLYRLTRGRVGGRVGRAPVLLLTTTGRKSGEKRTAPVLYLEEDGEISVINTNGGNTKVPAWSLNLDANPDAEIELGSRRVAVRARVAAGAERAELWHRHNVQYAGFDEYVEDLPDDRPVNIYVLEPREG